MWDNLENGLQFLVYSYILSWSNEYLIDRVLDRAIS